MTRQKTTAALMAMRRNAIAWLALFVALGGTAFAAATIGAGDIKDDAIRTRHIANGSVVGAAVQDGAIGTTDVANGAIRGRDIADATVRSQDIQDGTVAASDIANGVLLGDLGPNSVTGAEVDESTLGEVPFAANARRARALAEQEVFSDSNNLGSHVPGDGSSAPIATLDDPRFGPGSGDEWLFIGTLSVFNDDPAGLADSWRCKLDVAGDQRDQSITLPLASEGDVGYGTSLSFQVRGFATDDDEPDAGLYCSDNDATESIFVGQAAVTAIPMET